MAKICGSAASVHEHFTPQNQLTRLGGRNKSLQNGMAQVVSPHKYETSYNNYINGKCSENELQVASPLIIDDTSSISRVGKKSVGDLRCSTKNSRKQNFIKIKS